jgi:hypothetical protein
LFDHVDQARDLIRTRDDWLDGLALPCEPADSVFESLTVCNGESADQHKQTREGQYGPHFISMAPTN